MLPSLSRALAVLALGACAVLAGCGSSPSTPASGSSPSYANLTGNWQIQTGPQPGSSFPSPLGVAFFGNLLQNGAALSGTFQFSDVRTFGAPCVPLPTTVEMTGSVAASGAVSLTASLGGGTATIAFTAPSMTPVFLTATLTISGGSCVLPATSGLAGLIPNVSGTYSGPVITTNLITGAISNGSVQVQLTQSNSPNLLGQFPLTATLSLTSPSCSTTSSLTGTQSGVGYNLTAPNPLEPSIAQVLVLGTNDPAVPEAPVNLLASYISGPCSPVSAQGTLTLQ